MHEQYDILYLVSDDGNIYQIERGGSMGGLGNHLVIHDARSSERSRSMDMSVFCQQVAVGQPFSYHYKSLDKEGSDTTPIITEIIGVDFDYMYHGLSEIKTLPLCDIDERYSRVWQEARAQSSMTEGRE